MILYLLVLAVGVTSTAGDLLLLLLLLVHHWYVLLWRLVWLRPWLHVCKIKHLENSCKNVLVFYFTCTTYKMFCKCLFCM